MGKVWELVAAALDAECMEAAAETNYEHDPYVYRYSEHVQPAIEKASRATEAATKAVLALEAVFKAACHQCKNNHDDTQQGLLDAVEEAKKILEAL